MKEILEMDVQALQALQATGQQVRIVDVRSPEEFAEDHVEGAMNIPGPELPAHIEALRNADLVVCVCTKGGARSAEAATLLRAHGLQHARFLAGGTRAWLVSRADQEKP